MEKGEKEKDVLLSAIRKKEVFVPLRLLDGASDA
jgi:hypothetical protein